MSGKLLVVGQLSLDDLRSECGEVRDQPGGAALYVAMAAALQGCEVRLAAAAGKDYPDLASLARPKSLRLCEVRIKGDRSTRVRLSRRSGRMVEWSVDYGLGYIWPEELGDESRPSHVHLCAMPALLTHAWKAWASSSALPFSLSLAFGLGQEERLDQLSRSEALRLVSGAEFVFCNTREAEALTGTSGLPKLAERLVEMGVSQAIVTNGAQSCRYASRAGRGFACPVRSGTRVIDTTGAGDSLAGTVLGAMLSGLDCRLGLQLGIHRALEVIADFGPTRCSRRRNHGMRS